MQGPGNYELTKLRIAERHSEAARERIASQARSLATAERQKSSAEGQSLRQLVYRAATAVVGS